MGTVFRSPLLIIRSPLGGGVHLSLSPSSTLLIPRSFLQAIHQLPTAVQFSPLSFRSICHLFFSSFPPELADEIIPAHSRPLAIVAVRAVVFSLHFGSQTIHHWSRSSSTDVTWEVSSNQVGVSSPTNRLSLIICSSHEFQHVYRVYTKSHDLFTSDRDDWMQRHLRLLAELEHFHCVLLSCDSANANFYSQTQFIATRRKKEIVIDFWNLNVTIGGGALRSSLGFAPSNLETRSVSDSDK